MYSLIKPNSDWKKIANEWNCEFKKGTFLTPATLKISYKGNIYHIKTGFSSDNLWRAKTIIHCEFLYNKNFQLNIVSNILTRLNNDFPFKIRLTREFSDQKEESKISIH